MGNAEVETKAIELVMNRERELGRAPEDKRASRVGYDIFSPPRKIEVKAFSGPARGQPIPLEKAQVEQGLKDPDDFYVYVVENLRTPDQAGIVVLHGPTLGAMIARSVPVQTYWPTLRVEEYDAAARL